jgi:hypothetical protein
MEFKMDKQVMIVATAMVAIMATWYVAFSYLNGV